MSVRILLVEDHRIVREGLRCLLESQDGFEIVGEAEDGRAAIDMAKQCQPDIILMDIGMPNMNGIEATRLIRKDSPDIKVIAVSAHSERRTVQEMFRAGAISYVTKGNSSSELFKSIHDAVKGKTYLAPNITGVVVRNYVASVTGETGGGPDLTPREREVLQLLTEGLSAKETGHRLTISVKTVESHRRNLMAKTGFYNIVELTKYALREGITFLEH